MWSDLRLDFGDHFAHQGFGVADVISSR